MKVLAVSVWLSFTLLALFALLFFAREGTVSLRPDTFVPEPKEMLPSQRARDGWIKPKGHLKGGKVVFQCVSLSAEVPTMSTEEDMYLRAVKLESEGNYEALAHLLRTVDSEVLQRFIVNVIDPDCEVCLDALIWALTFSPVCGDAAKKLNGEKLLSVREMLFESLLENKDDIAQRQQNASAIIFLLSGANDDREQEMMVSLANTDLPASLRAFALRCIDPPFTKNAKDLLVALISDEDSGSLAIAALEKIRESPFAEVVPVLAQIAILYPERFGQIDEETGDVTYEVHGAGILVDRWMQVLGVLAEAGIPEVKNWLAEVAASSTLPRMRISALRYLNLLDSGLAVSLASDVFFSENCPDKQEFAKVLSSFMNAGECEEFFASVALNDADSDRRNAAVKILSEMASADGVGQLLLQVAVNDESWKVRENAVQALAKSDSPQVQRGLIEIAKSDVDSDVRRAAFNSLDLSSSENVSALIQIASQPRGSYYHAMKRLSSTGSPEVGRFFLSIIQEATRSSDGSRGCSCPDHNHDIAAAECLKDMGAEYRVAAYREVLCGGGYKRIRRRWAANAADYPEPEIEAILQSAAVSDPDERVRTAAIQSLHKIYQQYEEDFAKSMVADATESSSPDGQE